MKKLLFTFLFMLFAGFCLAQTEHMKFKGIPMEGTLQTFTNKLKAKGFTPINMENGVSLLKGEFAGYKGCIIGAVADQDGMICKVSVIFPEMDKWENLENCYLNYKSLLTEKYGEPNTCIEEFQSNVGEDNSMKLLDLKMDKCKYFSTFSCDNGEIDLEITYQNYSCNVMLSYYDKINQDKVRKKIMDDL